MEPSDEKVAQLLPNLCWCVERGIQGAG